MKKILLSAITLLSFGVVAQTHFSSDFESGDLTGWTAYDEDGDGQNWTNLDFSGNFAELGSSSAVSRSWTGTTGGLNPDNYLVSDAIDLTGVSASGLNMLFTTGTIEGSPYHAEHYAVYVTTANDIPTISASTPVFEETLPTPSAVAAQVIDMSAYAGMTVYVTFRHFNTFDMNTLIVDNVTVKTLLPDDVSVQGVDLARYAAVNTNNTLSVAIKNEGANAVSSVEIDWNDGTAHVQTVNTTIAPGATVNVAHPDNVTYAAAVQNSITVSVSAVNGNADSDPTNNAGDALINTVSQISPKAVVIEEGTGTWCQWCPRGEVAMKYMYDNYGSTGQFIGIAVHNNDPMALAEYDSGAALSGFPGCNVDRTLLGESVSQGLFEGFYNDRKDLVVPVAVDLTPTVSGNDVSIAMKATWFTPISNADYRMAVVVMQDHMSGTSNDWAQVNAYAGGNAGPMGGYENLPNPVPASQMEYSHVGVALLGGYDGQAGTIATTITDGHEDTYTFNYTIPAGVHAQQLDAVGLVIDQTNGNIVNAKKVNMDGSLGIMNENKMNLTVYPNPATNNVSLSFEATEGDYQVTIHDLSGRMIANNVYNNLSGAQTVQLATDAYKAGQYLITLSAEGQSYTQILTIN